MPMIHQSYICIKHSYESNKCFRLFFQYLLHNSLQLSYNTHVINSIIPMNYYFKHFTKLL